MRVGAGRDHETDRGVGARAVRADAARGSASGEALARAAAGDDATAPEDRSRATLRGADASDREDDSAAKRRATARVPAELGGLRLDLALARLVPDVSRSQAGRLVAAGRVRLNGAIAKASERLRVGDELIIELPEAPAPGPVPEDIPLRVVYADEDILVVDKPAGLVVHPAPGHPSGTLVNALLALDPDLTVGDEQRPGIVHRLDKDTSGLLVVARNDAALRNLQAQWASRNVLKRYLALVDGVPREPEAVIEAPIGRSPRDRKKMAVVAGGRAATSRYRIVKRFPKHALLEVTIETGRTHQIRVHLASIGHPVVGDPVYGHAGPRLMLHAQTLGFRHPRTGQWMELMSSAPPEVESPP